MSNFLVKGIEVVEDIISSEKLLLLKERISYLDKTNSFSRKDELVPNAKHIYGDIVFDNLLLDIKSVVEKITNKKLIEQYSYLRLYSPGDVMYKHKDRNSCEYSVSLCIDSNLITLYPLMVEDKNKQINAVCLEPGSAVVYAGTELVHWRDMFLGKYLAQVFLHYVDADGPYKDQKYDGRKSLGKSFTTKCL